MIAVLPVRVAVTAAVQVVGPEFPVATHEAIMASWSVQYSLHTLQVTGQKPLTCPPHCVLVQKAKTDWQGTPNTDVAYTS